MSESMWRKAEAYRLLDEAINAVDTAGRQLGLIRPNGVPLGEKASNDLDKANDALRTLLWSIESDREAARGSLWEATRGKEES